MKIKILSAFLLTFALFNAVSAQTPDKAKLDRFFDRLAEKNKAMGSLTIAKDGSLLYTRAIGYSQINGSERKPATTATRYRVGSITKMFTAAMIFQFVEKGKLKLSDTLDKFFPQIPNAKKITIAHMLAHRSGIHNLTDNPDFRTWMMNPKTKDEVLAIIAKGTPDFEPDAKYSSSNSNYVVLGYIVEKLTGKPYQEALKERITSKIGLKDTYLGTGKSDIGKNESFSYRYAGDWKQETEIDLSIPGGAGAIISTPSDLTKFIQALFDLKLVSKESLNQMMQNRMGMSSLPLGEKTFYGHAGSIDGFRSMLVYLPEEKLAVAYTSNGMVYPAKNIISGVFEIYQNKPFEIPTFESIAVSPEILEKYVGVYSSPGFPLKVTITRDATTLYAQTTGQSSFPRLQEQGRLSVSDTLMKFFKDVPDDKQQITVHHLLAHTSGLPHKYAADGIIEREKAVQAILTLPLAWKVGEGYHYSNDGYNLLAAIVEIASKRTFEDYLRKDIFKPAKLNNTGFWGYEAKTQIVPAANVANTQNARPTIYKNEKSVANWGYRGATGIYTTAADLYRWMLALQQNEVLTPKTREQIWGKQTLQTRISPTEEQFYGYGWGVRFRDGKKIYVRHTGYEDWLGHSSVMCLYENGDAYVVLSNAVQGDAAWSSIIARELQKRLQTSN